MTDLIRIKGLRLQARIGVDEAERGRLQTVVIDVDVAGDLSDAGSSDDIDDTLDYGLLVAYVAEVTAGFECRLLERLATVIAERISAMERVEAVTVEIWKSDPPLEEEVGAVAVRIERTGA